MVVDLSGCTYQNMFRKFSPIIVTYDVCLSRGTAVYACVSPADSEAWAHCNVHDIFRGFETGVVDATT